MKVILVESDLIGRLETLVNGAIEKLRRNAWWTLSTAPRLMADTTNIITPRW